MSIWGAVLSNPAAVDAIMALLALGAGALGVDRWRSKARASTVEQVDSWASTAAGVVTLAIESGEFGDATEEVDGALKLFHRLAAIAGVQVSPQHEARALKAIIDALNYAAALRLPNKVLDVTRAAKAAAARLERLPWPK